MLCQFFWSVKDCCLVSSAVLGPTFSSESAVVSRILSSVPDDYKLLQVSYSSTAAFLTNKTNAETFLNFFRTIPSDKIQTQVHVLSCSSYTRLMILSLL